jgi:hypothetical protein
MGKNIDNNEGFVLLAANDQAIVFTVSSRTDGTANNVYVFTLEYRPASCRYNFGEIRHNLETLEIRTIFFTG